MQLCLPVFLGLPYVCVMEWIEDITQVPLYTDRSIETYTPTGANGSLCYRIGLERGLPAALSLWTITTGHCLAGSLSLNLGCEYDTYCD